MKWTEENSKPKKKNEEENEKEEKWKRNGKEIAEFEQKSAEPVSQLK